MVIFLMITGALFFLAGMVFGLISVFWGSDFQFYLCREHEEIFSRLAASGAGPADAGGRSVNSASLWRYIKSPEDNVIPGIFMYKNKIKRSFIIFAIFCMIGVSSFFAAAVVLIVL